MANFYGAESYGEYLFLASFVGFGGLFQEIISKKIVMKDYVDGSTRNVLMVSFSWKLLIYFIVLLLPALYFYMYIDLYFFYVFILLYTNEVVKLLCFPLEVKSESAMKFALISKVNLISIIVLTLVQLYTLYIGMTIIYIALVAVVGSVIRFAIFKLSMSRCGLGLEYRLEGSKKSAFSLMDKSKYLCISYIYYVTYVQLDKIMIGILGDVSDVADYGIANQFIVALTLLIPIYQKIIYPILLRGRDNLNSKFIKYNSIITWVYILIIPLAIYVVNATFGLFYDEVYFRAINVFGILSVGVLFVANGSLRVLFLTIESQTKVLMYIGLIGTFINVFLNYFLIKTIGFYGAAIATVITQAVASNFIYFFIPKYRYIFFMQLRSLMPSAIFKK